jgi:hypothetical protein
MAQTSGRSWSITWQHKFTLKSSGQNDRQKG